MAPYDALQFAIGQYVTVFANLETVIATHVSYLLELDHKLVFFMLKDILVSQKIKLVRRAAVQKFGEDKCSRYRAVLNKIDKATEFRNTLVHGAFTNDDERGYLLGKLGHSLTDMDKGLEPIGYARVQEEARTVDALAAELIAALRNLQT